MSCLKPFEKRTSFCLLLGSGKDGSVLALLMTEPQSNGIAVRSPATGSGEAMTMPRFDGTCPRGLGPKNIQYRLHLFEGREGPGCDACGMGEEQDER